MHTVNITKPVPSHQLTTTQLIQRCKAMESDPQIAYGLFVRERGLKPEISMNGFIRVFGNVRPNHHVVQRIEQIEPTHFDVATLSWVQITDAGDHYRLVFENGMTGTEPYLTERYVPLENSLACQAC